MRGGGHEMGRVTPMSYVRTCRLLRLISWKACYQALQTDQPPRHGRAA